MGARLWILFAALNGAVAVAMGAYAAHGLASDPALQALAARASEYQLIHALALLAADRLAAEGRRVAHAAAAFFALGMALFCGSLYFKALAAAPLPVPMMTPAGGVCFMLGWLALAGAAFRYRCPPIA